MWSDYVYKLCRRCGIKGYCSRESDICRACLIGSCGDPSCHKHDKAGQ
jgi:hypothetical protein